MSSSSSVLHRLQSQTPRSKNRKQRKKEAALSKYAPLVKIPSMGCRSPLWARSNRAGVQARAPSKKGTYGCRSFHIAKLHPKPERYPLKEKQEELVRGVQERVAAIVKRGVVTLEERSWLIWRARLLLVTVF